MALQRTTVGYPFGGGVDEKKARAHGTGNDLQAVLNGFQQKTGELRMRNTATALNMSLVGGGSLSAATDGQVYRDQLILRNGKQIYGYDAGIAGLTNRWSNLGTSWQIKPTVTPIDYDKAGQSGSTAIRAADVAHGGGLTAYTYLSDGKIYADIFDETTGLPVVMKQGLYTSGTVGQVPKVVAAGTNFIFFWSEEAAGASTLKATKVSQTAPQTFPAATTIATDLMGTTGAEDGTVYDIATTTSSTVFVVYGREAAGTYYWTRLILSTTSMTVTVGPSSTAFAADPDLVLGILTHDYADGFAYVAVGTTTAGSIMVVHKVDLSTCAVSASGSNVGAGVQPYNATGYWTGAQYVLFFECIEAGVLKIKKSNGDFTPAASTANWKFRCGLASKVFKFSSDGARLLMLTNYSNNQLAPYVNSATDRSDTPQNFYAVVDETGYTVARVLYRNAGPLLRSDAGANGTNTRGGLPFAVALTADKYVTVGMRAVELTGGGFTSFGVAKLTFEFGAAFGKWKTATSGIEPGGITRNFDGRVNAEANFLEHPQRPIITAGAGGGLTASATYGYSLVWVYYNLAGELVRSEPSPPQAIVLGPAETSADLTISTLQFTDRRVGGPFGAIQEVVCEVYRTTANDSTYFLVGTVTNDTSASTITFSDVGNSDASIADNEALYSQPDGAVLVNQPPPAFLDVEYWNGRFFGISAENPSEIWYSQEIEDGFAPAFNSQLVVRIDESAVGLVGMDDKLVIFSALGGYVLTGDGPDGLGQGLYVRPQKVQGFAGCSDPRSIARTANGVMRNTSKGTWLLSRGLDDSYIGAGVEDSNSLTITGASVPPGTNQARFTTSTTTQLYDWLFGQWYRWNGQGAVASFIWRNTWTYITSAGVVYTEDTSVAADPGYTLSFVTEWIKLSTLVSGYERCKRVILEGEYRDAHTISIVVRYDYDDSGTETHTFDSANHVPTLATGRPERMDIRNSVEKCEAIQFDVTITPKAGAAEPMRPWGLSFDMAVKSGVARLPTANRVT